MARLRRRLRCHGGLLGTLPVVPAEALLPPRHWALDQADADGRGRERGAVLDPNYLNNNSNDNPPTHRWSSVLRGPRTSKHPNIQTSPHPNSQTHNPRDIRLPSLPKLQTANTKLCKNEDQIWVGGNRGSVSII